jgi:hypothetical protein
MIKIFWWSNKCKQDWFRVLKCSRHKVLEVFCTISIHYAINIENWFEESHSWKLQVLRRAFFWKTHQYVVVIWAGQADRHTNTKEWENRCNTNPGTFCQIICSTTVLELWLTISQPYFLVQWPVVPRNRPW